MLRDPNRVLSTAIDMHHDADKRQHRDFVQKGDYQLTIEESRGRTGIGESTPACQRKLRDDFVCMCDGVEVTRKQPLARQDLVNF